MADQINKPVFEHRDDPFVDFAILIEKFGFDRAAALALRHMPPVG